MVVFGPAGQVVELLVVEEAEIVDANGDLDGYGWARDAGCMHATIVGAVTVLGLLGGLLNGFLERMTASPGADRCDGCVRDGRWCWVNRDGVVTVRDGP